MPPIALALLSLIAMLLVLLAPPATGPVALVFPPWWNPAQVAAAALQAGRPIRFGGAGFIVVVAPIATQRAGGAWLRLNPRLVGGCTQTENPQKGQI